MGVCGNVCCVAAVVKNSVFLALLQHSKAQKNNSEISSPRWSSVYECQRVECAFTSPVVIELDMLVMYCMQFVMYVSVVSMVSCCGVSW